MDTIDDFKIKTVYLVSGIQEIESFKRDILEINIPKNKKSKYDFYQLENIDYPCLVDVDLRDDNPIAIYHLFYFAVTFQNTAQFKLKQNKIKIYSYFDKIGRMPQDEQKIMDMKAYLDQDITTYRIFLISCGFLSQEMDIQTGGNNHFLFGGYKTTDETSIGTSSDTSIGTSVGTSVETSSASSSSYEENGSSYEENGSSYEENGLIKMNRQPRETIKFPFRLPSESSSNDSSSSSSYEYEYEYEDELNIVLDNPSSYEDELLSGLGLKLGDPIADEPQGEPQEGDLIADNPQGDPQSMSEEDEYYYIEE